jgi:hypothetical protein
MISTPASATSILGKDEVVFGRPRDVSAAVKMGWRDLRNCTRQDMTRNAVGKSRTDG